MKVSQYITLNDLPVLDPVELYNRCEFLRSRGVHVDTNKFWGKCNSWTYGTGFEPGRGYLLMSGDSVQTLRASINQASHVLKFGGSDGDLHFLDLMIIGAEAILGGPSFSAETPYVVTLADKRVLGPLSFINLEINTYSATVGNTNPPNDFDDQDYVWAHSKKSGVTNWTYEDLIELLWTGVSATYNNSKVTPLTTIFDCDTPNLDDADFSGKTPFNYSFRGIPAWSALQTILEDTQHILILDRDGNFKIKSAFDTDTDLSEAKSNASKFLLDNTQDVNNISHKIPEKIRVLFPSRSPSWWTGNDYGIITPNDYRHHTPFYTKEVSTGVIGAIANTILPIQDTLIANYDETGTIQNQTACDNRATQVKDDFIAAIQNQSPSEFAYSTARDFECGRQVRALCYADFGDGVKTIVKTDYQNNPISPLINQPGSGSPFDRFMFSSKENTMPPQLSRLSEVPDRFVLVYIDPTINGDVIGGPDPTIKPLQSGFARVEKITNGASTVTVTNGGGTGGIIKVWDVLGQSWMLGSYAIAWHHPQSRRWVLISGYAHAYGNFKPNVGGTTVATNEYISLSKTINDLQGMVLSGDGKTITFDGSGTFEVNWHFTFTGCSDVEVDAQATGAFTSKSEAGAGSTEKLLVSGSMIFPEAAASATLKFQIITVTGGGAALSALGSVTVKQLF